MLKVLSMEKNRALLAVLIIRSIYAGFFLLTKLALDVGMDPFVFVFYRQAAATLFLAPFAFFQRKTAPRLSLSILCKIFMLSLIGITVSLDTGGVALKYTTASLGAATANTLPPITFFIAVLLRMEKVKIRERGGMMKIVGVCVCIGGSATIAFYRGPLLKVYHHNHHLLNDHSSRLLPSTTTWINGVLLMLLSNTTWALWLVLQGGVLKSYPSKLMFTTVQCFMSAIQSLISALAFARDPAQWKLGWNLRLLSVAYCGIVVTGVSFYMQAWVIEKKGPVYLAMTTPLIFVFTLIFSTFVFGETINFGSVLGAILLVGGLYFVLWGQTMEEPKANLDAEKACHRSAVGLVAEKAYEESKGDGEKTISQV